MTREELESRSKPELIDLALQQQALIAQLQARAAELQAQAAQLQLASRNGEAMLAAGVPEAPAQRSPLGLKVLLALIVVFGCAVTLIVTTVTPPTFVNVGRAADFAPSSVKLIRVPKPNSIDPPVPMYLVNDLSAGFLALSNQDPHSGCSIEWKAAAHRFEDACLGSTYTPIGGYVSGPATRGLDRYPVNVTEDGAVRIDVSKLQSGPPRP